MDKKKEKKNISKVREKIGMVFQSYDLFPNMTILNNLLLAPMKVQKRKKRSRYRRWRGSGKADS